MPLTLKQQMAKTLARRVVEQSDRFPKAAERASVFLQFIDSWGDHPAYREGWEEHMTHWHEFRPLLEEALPALMETDK